MISQEQLLPSRNISSWEITFYFAWKFQCFIYDLPGGSGGSGPSLTGFFGISEINVKVNVKFCSTLIL